MANRREFLQLSAAALGLMTVPHRVLAGLTPDLNNMPFYRVFYDERYEDSRVFAGEARNMGAVTTAITGDVGELWYGGLRKQLSEQSGMIAGLTTETDAFLIELLSHDVFYHQVFRGEHRFRDDNLIGHRIDGPEQFLEQTSSLPLNREYWSTDLARLFSLYDNVGPTYPRVSKHTRGDQDESTLKLVSWIIVPLSRK